MDIYFADESGFEGDPRPRKRWDKKGRKTRLTQNGGHLRIKARWFNNHVCKNEEKFLERLDQAILGVIDNPQKTQQTTAIGTLF